MRAHSRLSALFRFPRSSVFSVFSAGLGALALLCAGALDAPAQAIPNNVTFRNYFGTMVFNRPVLFAQYPGEDSAHIVLQQSGKIITVRRQGGNWAKTDSASVTVTGGTISGDERGLLGFAFHPNFNQNRKYYIYYIGGANDIIAERIADVSLRPKTSDAQRTLFRIADPYENHNGGTIGFGADGYLYLALGDGGSGGDPQNRAQNKTSLFGKILRFNIDGADAFPSDTTRNYAIPADNPFVDSSTYAPEIWALGVRNPWKWSFHPLTGVLWVGDVGQGAYEEITTAPKGANLGWKIREGAFCYTGTTCSSAGLTAPAKTMGRGHAYSITGGVVFTGNTASAYHGVYIFGDYGTDHVWAMRPNGSLLSDSVRIGSVANVSSFDRDARGRVFATSIGTGDNVDNTGVVYILESPDMTPGPVNIRKDRRGNREGLKPLRLGEVLRNPADYQLHALDGQKVSAASAFPSGIFWVTEKSAASRASLMMLP